MLINIGIQVEADFDASNNASLDGVRFPGQSQNLLQYMSAEEVEQARLAAMVEYERELREEAAEIAERREMAGDARRERLRDDRLTGDVL